MYYSTDFLVCISIAPRNNVCGVREFLKLLLWIFLWKWAYFQKHPMKSRIFLHELGHTHPFKTHSFNGPLSGSTRVSRYQKGKTNLDFTGARDSEWQWHQLGDMQVYTSLQTDNHTSTPPFSSVFLQTGCPFCHPTNSVKALKAMNELGRSLWISYETSLF